MTDLTLVTNIAFGAIVSLFIIVMISLSMVISKMSLAAQRIV